MLSGAELLEWIEDADASDTDRLEELAAAAVAHAQRSTGRYFGAVEQTTEILTGSGKRRLYLTDLPALVGIPAAYDVAVEYGDPGDDLTADTDFELRQAGIEAWLERTDGGVWSKEYEYHVTYSRGYEDGAEPADIRRYVIAWVSQRWALRGSEGLASESIGGYSYTLARDQRSPELDEMVAYWRRPVSA